MKQGQIEPMQSETITLYLGKKVTERVVDTISHTYIDVSISRSRDISIFLLCSSIEMYIFLHLHIYFLL